VERPTRVVALVGFHEVDKVGHAAVEQRSEFGAGDGGIAVTRVKPGQDLAGGDPVAAGEREGMECGGFHSSNRKPFF
jgi:hypothetical protein